MGFILTFSCTCCEQFLPNFTNFWSNCPKIFINFPKNVTVFLHISVNEALRVSFWCSSKQTNNGCWTLEKSHNLLAIGGVYPDAVMFMSFVAYPFHSAGKATDLSHVTININHSYDNRCGLLWKYQQTTGQRMFALY